MRARLAISLALAGLLVAGCGPKAPPVPQIALIANSAGFGDRGYNDAAAAGLAECRRETGLSATTAVAANDDDIESKAILYATERFDTIVGIGYAAAPGIMSASRRFEAPHFALIDAVVERPNVVSLTFDEAQGAFLAGALAGLASASGRVAFIGGADVALLERSEAGFRAGVREAAPGVRVDTRFLGTFTDAAAGRRAAEALLAAGDDVIYIVAGPAGRGAIDAVAARPHAYAIGSDVDEDALAPGKMLGSVVKGIDQAVLRVCLDTVTQKPESGHVVLGLAEGGIGLTHPALAAAVLGARKRDRLDRLGSAVAAGELRVPDSRAELARFVPLALP
jgi:basic membrane protein A